MLYVRVNDHGHVLRAHIWCTLTVRFYHNFTYVLGES